MILYPKGFNYLIVIKKATKLIFYINYIFSCIYVDFGLDWSRMPDINYFVSFNSLINNSSFCNEIDIVFYFCCGVFLNCLKSAVFDIFLFVLDLNNKKNLQILSLG